ncbi:AraC family transcriptional regulator [Treponema pectinovorum]|uniref:AraC family transcriptional regulator n=1 Tax=Treponema pectinovorum TaxID=164 RepID=UPI0011CCC183|nr:AraC family transcriptional regulator [Treponema pectinovorum]
METVHFENNQLPLYCKTESFEKQTEHSAMSHWHENIEMVCVIEGSLVCKTSGLEFSLKKGDVCFINRKQLHLIYTKDKNTLQTVFILGTSLISQNSFIYEKHMQQILEDPLFSHAKFDSDTISAINFTISINHIQKLLAEKEIGYEFEAMSEIYKICKHLCIAYKSSSQNLVFDNNALTQQKMAEYIYLNYSKPLTLDNIASSGCVSRSQCTKLFRHYASISPIAFLNRHRLEVSCDFLRSTTNSIAEISLNCGFTDQSYFNRLFFKNYGCTPLSYRKRV